MKRLPEGLLQSRPAPRRLRRAIGLAAFVVLVSALGAEAGPPQPRSADPLLRITGLVTDFEISQWVQEPGMTPSAFITIHTEAGDVSAALPVGKGLAAHCFVGDRATVEGYYWQDRPHEPRYFNVATIEPCSHHGE